MKRILRALPVAALMALLSLPGFAAQNQSQRGPDATDAAILQSVQKQIADHPSFKDIKASVEDRLVTLTGSVDNFYNKLRAGRILGSANDNAQGIRNLLTVNTPSVPDQELQSTLADRLRYDRIDRGIMFNNFTLGVNNGNVTLGGQARTYADKDSALDIVENTKGVKNVVDNVQVLPTSIFDDQLRVRVARAIYGNSTLQRYANDPQAPIRIVVNNGHVTLDGVVDTRLDKQVAGSQANSVSGVFSVKNNLVVANQEAKK